MEKSTIAIRVPRFIARTFPGLVSKSTAGFMDAEVSGLQYEGSPDSDIVYDAGTFLEAYTKHPWIYAGGIACGIAAPKPPLRVYKATSKNGKAEKEEIVNQDINRLYRRPNQYLSYRELIQLTAINLVITGQFYWNLVGQYPDYEIGPGNPPLEIWWMKPSQVTIKPGVESFIDKYVYTTSRGREIPLHPSEVIHFKLVNPDSYFYGQSRIEAAKTASISDFYAIAFNKNYLKNDAVPPGYFTAPDRMKDGDLERLKNRWTKELKGSDRAGILGLLYGGVEFKELGKGPKDAQYMDLRKMNREEILACLGVPPSVVGLLEYANYSNMDIQQSKFWEDTVVPILDLIADKLTLSLAPIYNEDYWFEYDYSEISHLQDDENQKANTATSLVNSGVMTRDEVRSKFYNLPPLPGGAGSILWLPISMVPVTSTKPPKDESGDKKALPEKTEDPKKADDEDLSFWERGTRKEVLWRSFEKRIRKRESRFADTIDDYLSSQATKIANKVRKYKNPAMNIDKIFDIEAETKRYHRISQATYFDAFREGGESGIAAAKGMIYAPETERLLGKDDLPFEIRPEYQAELETMIFDSGTKINQETLKLVVEKIQEGAKENWTTAQLARAIEDQLTSYAAFRSRRVARTELAKTENWGQIEGYKQSEFIELKGWLSAFTKDTRETHKDADRKYSSDPIPLDDPFVVGGEELQYPGDYRGSPGNVINCLCSTFPVVKQY